MARKKSASGSGAAAALAIASPASSSLSLSDALGDDLELVEAYRTDACVRELCVAVGISEEDWPTASRTLPCLEWFMTLTPQMKPVQWFAKLRSIYIIKAVNLKELEGLDACSGTLEVLHVTECALESLNGLSSCRALTKLDVSANKLQDLGALAGLTSLTCVWANENRLKRVSGLQGLGQLRTLWLASNRLVKAAEGLEGQVSCLEELNLADNRVGCFKVLLPFRSFPALRTLLLKDVHFGDNPVCGLSNYQTFATYHLKQLTFLDGQPLTEESKSLAASIFMKKHMYYNMRARTSKRLAGQAARCGRQLISEAMEGIQMNLTRINWQLKYLDAHHGNQSVAEAKETDLERVQIAIKKRKLLEASKLAEKVLSESESEAGYVAMDAARVCEQSVSQLLLEFSMGGNVRFEEGLESHPWHASCMSMVKHCTPKDLSVEVHRVLRIHNRHLRDRFESIVKDIKATALPVLPTSANNVGTSTSTFNNISSNSSTLNTNTNMNISACVDGGEESSLPDEKSETTEIVGSDLPQTSTSSEQQEASSTRASSQQWPFLEYMFYTGRGGNGSPRDIAEDGFTALEEAAEGVDRETSRESCIRFSSQITTQDIDEMQRAQPKIGETHETDDYDSTIHNHTKSNDVVSIVEKSSLCQALICRVCSDASSEGRTWVRRPEGAGGLGVNCFLFDERLALPEYIVEFEVSEKKNGDGGASEGDQLLERCALELKGGDAATVSDIHPFLPPLGRLIRRLNATKSAREGVLATMSTALSLPPHIPDEDHAQRLHTNSVPPGPPTSENNTPIETNSTHETSDLTLMDKSLAESIPPPLPLWRKDECLSAEEEAQNIDVDGGGYGGSLNLFRLEQVEDRMIKSMAPGLQVLIISYCHLQSIPGLPPLPALRTLDMSYNRVSSLSYFPFTPLLTSLSLRANKVSDVDELIQLTLSGPLLATLDVTLCPICDMGVGPLRRAAARVLPELEHINGQPVEEHDRPQDTLCDSAAVPLMAHRLWGSQKQRQNQRLRCKGGTALRNGDVRDAVECDMSGLGLLQWPSLSRAAALTKLDLSCNMLSQAPGKGSETENRLISIAQTLQEINLEGNEITTTGAQALALLTGIRKLDMGYNFLTSVAPLCQLTNLTQLSLESNRLTSLSGLSSLVRLVELYVGNNRLIDVEELSHLQPLSRLIVLDTSGNEMCKHKYHRPCAIYKLPHLKVLNGVLVTAGEVSEAMALMVGHLTEPLLAGIVGHCRWPSVRSLALNKAKWHNVSVLSTLPLVSLTELSLERNLLTSFSILASLPCLTHLNLTGNRIDAAIPAVPPPPCPITTVVTTTVTLATSDLKNTADTNKTVGDAGLSSVQSADGESSKKDPSGEDVNGGGGVQIQEVYFPQLQVLLLGKNCVLDLAPLQMQRIPSLLALDLRGNSVTSLTNLGCGSKLQELCLDGCKIRTLAGAAIAFQGLTQLRKLRLENNGLRTLSSLGNAAVSLLSLRLAHNRIADPSELDKLGPLPLLQDLSVLGNALVRRLPSIVAARGTALQTKFPALCLLDGCPIVPAAPPPPADAVDTSTMSKDVPNVLWVSSNPHHAAGSVAGSGTGKSEGISATVSTTATVIGATPLGGSSTGGRGLLHQLIAQQQQQQQNGTGSPGGGVNNTGLNSPSLNPRGKRRQSDVSAYAPVRLKTNGSTSPQPLPALSSATVNSATSSSTSISNTISNLSLGTGAVLRSPAAPSSGGGTHAGKSLRLTSISFDELDLNAQPRRGGSLGGGGRKL